MRLRLEYPIAFGLIGALVCSCRGGEDSTPDAGGGASPPPGSLLWAQHIGGADYIESAETAVGGNQGHSVAAITDGTFYAGGSFMNEAVFGDGAENEVVLQSAGGEWDGDAFLGRWRPDGAPDWVISVGGDEPSGLPAEEQIDGFAELEVLPGESVVAIARLESGANLDPLGESAVGGEPFHAPVYHLDGRLNRFLPYFCVGEAWVHGAAYSTGLSLDAAEDGSYVSAGRPVPNDYTVVVGEGEPNETTLVPDPEGTGMSVVAVFNPEGTLRWAVKLENGSHELDVIVSEIAIAPDGSVVAGVFASFGIAGAEALVGSTDGSTVSAAFVEDPEIDETADLLVKWDSGGEVEWVKQIPPIYSPTPLLVRDDGTIILIDSYLDGVTFDPGGSGETVIDHGPCDEQFCTFAVEVAPNGSSFEPHLLAQGGSYATLRPNGSFALASYSDQIAGYSANYDLEWEARIEPTTETAGAWIHDIAALVDGSIVVIGDYNQGVVFGAGEPNETEIHGICEKCNRGAFLARYAW